MVRDYWVYQRRDTETPWAIYVVKEFDRKNPAKTEIAYTLYSEEIENQTHSKSFDSVHRETIAGYVSEVLSGFSRVGIEICPEDVTQLNESIECILLD